ncbi:MAG: AhpC/TSA family protein [Bacteroidales bacterium]|nr:MAG: AhpC/TSA family protein [Bacteroidales bacterium]
MMNFLKVRYLGFCAVVVLLSLSSCSNKDSVVVRVKITNNADSKIYIDKLNYANSQVIDSSEISKGENLIRFKVKSVFEPTFLVIRVPEHGAITLLCEPNEKMNLIVNTDKYYDYTVLDSKGSQKTKELAAKLSDSKKKLYDLKVKFNLAKEEGLKSLIEQEYNATIDSQRAYNSKFIWANTMSRASVMAVYQKFDDEFYVFDRSEDIVLFKAVASSLRAIYPNSDYTKGMLVDIKRMEEIVRSAKLKNMISTSVSSIPDITLSNPKGDVIKLSSFKGKVILLNFWASWDQSSMMDIRELIETYSQFKNKGFEIYQVSLDTNRDDWVNAIESAGLPGVNVCELNPNGSLDARIYNVSQLPSNYLIDKNFTIVGKNLFGEALKKKIREIL